MVGHSSYRLALCLSVTFWGYYVASGIGNAAGRYEVAGRTRGRWMLLYACKKPILVPGPALPSGGPGVATRAFPRTWDS